ncbi:MAG: LuxR C-terminal-related transcriptional regulator, partial [Actinomycetota bacterium]
MVAERPRSRGAGGLGLTAREAEIADLLLDRRTDREIAHSLYLSRRTVTTHVSS